MKVSKAVQLWLEYHKSNSKDNTLRAYEAIFSKFCQEFGGKNLKTAKTEGSDLHS